MRQILTIFLFCVIIAISFATKSSAQNPLTFFSVERLDIPQETQTPNILPLFDKKRGILYYVSTEVRKKNDTEILGHQFIKACSESPDKQWLPIENDIESLNNERNTGVVGISTEGDTLYLYGSYSPKGKDANGMSYTVRSEDGWAKPTQINFHDNFRHDSLYSFYMHPEGDLLLISKPHSDASGEDLFISLKKDGHWSSPKRLKGANSKYFEISPFITDDKTTLFFSSDRPGGEGGADVYYCTRLDDSFENWSAPINLGAPVNSSGFDAYFSYYPEKELAYFASNRDDTYSQIYTAHSTIPLAGQEEDTLKATPLAQGNTPPPGIVKSPASGLTTLPVIASAHFDFDRYKVRVNDKKRLNESLVEFMKKQPDTKVMLVGYTDSIGNMKYNLFLSKERSNAVKKFLIQNGIKANRIKASGEGESNPVRPNSTPQGRQANRRVDILLMENK
ncbi:hypothetical protein FUAX_13560 [Fulvitalea axinellae]|uniref:OmpA-like domain-containing protein n=1 Tax=Fulvitalea axinellae TaxID=1182444 RepID=A0AAU9CA38_9BACT|nr:hypothetical protein FUAX_13560 [Fulvitalea axinellae]